MKNAILPALLLAACTSVLAQSTTTPTTPSPAAGSTERFDEHKQRLLAKISEHIARMQQVQSCVQAATDHAQMQACRPRHQGTAPAE